MTTVLKPFQKEGVRKISEFQGRALIADEMGLGKSVQSLFWARDNLAKSDKVLIICPALLKHNWQNEISIHLNRRAEILEGMKVPKVARGQKPTNVKFVIINYDILGPWMSWIEKLDPLLVIIDEVHYLQNRTAKRTKLVKQVARNAPFVLCIGGTPFTNRPAELWNVLNILRPDRFKSFFSYGMRYCSPRKRPWGWEWKGAVRLKELHKILKKELMIRRLKEDVLKDLPKMTRRVVTVPISKRKEYEAAERNFLVWLAKNNKKAAAKAKKAEKMVMGGYLLRLVAELKLPSIFAWIDSFREESDEKIILFGINRKIIHQIHEHCGKHALIAHGGIPSEKRKGIFHEFQTNPRCRFLVCNIEAAGVGWNGTAASHVGHFQISYYPRAHTQAEKRADRIGQTKPVTSHYLVAKDTIEEKLCRILQKKQQIENSILDGGASSHIQTLDVFDELEQSLLKGIRD